MQPRIEARSSTLRGEYSDCLVARLSEASILTARLGESGYGGQATGATGYAEPLFLFRRVFAPMFATRHC